ncbi:MAG: PQQ-binding-like beta-propeller repeat protein [Vicinamibacteria bacterium]
MTRRAAFWIAILFAPPLSLIPVWLRTDWGMVKKLAGTVAILLLCVAYLFLVFGMRLQTEGTGLPTIVTFESGEDRYRAVEEDRARQKESPPPPVTARMEPDVPSPEVEDVDLPVPDSPPEPWVEFRGRGRAGSYAGPIRTDWESGLDPIWRQPAGGGYASFSIAEGRAFTIEQRHDEEVVAAYDVQTGRELWTHAWPAHFQEMLGGDGPRATPAWRGGYLYALGAMGELRKLDAATGGLVWRKNILEEAGAANLTWGMAASPLVVDGMVIVLPGGRGASVVAYDAETGAPLWRALDDKAAYAAPMIGEVAGERQLLVVSALRLMGLRIESGKLLWEFPWTTSNDINVAQPLVVDESQVFISAGYGHGAALIEVSAQKGYEIRVVWENVSMKNKFTSSVLHEGYIYGLDEAILACIDARTGERKWKGGRYGYGQLLLASGHLVVLTEGGDLALVRATPEKFDERARIPAIEGKTWNHPAIADGILLVRNLREMAAFDLRPR